MPDQTPPQDGVTRRSFMTTVGLSAVAATAQAQAERLADDAPSAASQDINQFGPEPARIRRVASSPSIPGICTSIRMMSNFFCEAARTASIPLLATPAALEDRQGELLIPGPQPGSGQPVSEHWNRYPSAHQRRTNS